MGRLPVYGAGWKQRVYELANDVGLSIQAASKRSGISIDGICRLALRAEQRARSTVDLVPWVEVAARPQRRVLKTKARKRDASRDVFRVGVQVCERWDLATDTRGVAGMISAGVERLGLSLLDGAQIRRLAGLTVDAEDAGGNVVQGPA